MAVRPRLRLALSAEPGGPRCLLPVGGRRGGDRAAAGLDGLDRQPRGAVPDRAHAQTDTPLTGSDDLAGLLLSEDDAAAYAALREATSGSAVEDILVLDEVPGLSLVLGAPPYAEAWTSAVDQVRTRLAVAAVCEEDGPPSLIILTREMSAEDVNALRECGIRLPR